MVLKHKLFIQDKEFPEIISAKYTAKYNKPAKLELQLAFYNELMDTDFALGDKVLFMRGYGTEYATRFVGYIESVSEAQPYVITCYDKLYFLGKEDANFSNFKNSTDKEILHKVFVEDNKQGDFNSDLRTVYLDFKANELSYAQLPAAITKESLLFVLAVNGQWQYYIDMGNTLVVEQPYTRSNIDEITEEDIIAKTYNIKGKLPEEVNVRLISIDSGTKKITIRENGDWIDGAKVVEQKLVDVNYVVMMERIKTIQQQHLEQTIEGDFSITGGVNGKVVAVNVGDVLNLNFKGDKKQICVEGVEETFDNKGITQKIYLKSIAE